MNTDTDKENADYADILTTKNMNYIIFYLK